MLFSKDATMGTAGTRSEEFAETSAVLLERRASRADIVAIANA
jgi:hypothetical protein